MNFKNLAMWAIIVVLTIGLYNMFKNPQNIKSTSNEKIIFSEFLKEVDNGRVVDCLLCTSPSPRDKRQSRMPSSA